MRSTLIAFTLTICFETSLFAAEPTAIDFNRDIRPILSDNCFHCHGPDPGQRQADLRFDTEEGAFADLGDDQAIVRGKPSDSELVKRITSADPDTVMPPPDHRKQLNEQQKKLLTQWVQEGATWSEHWAYIPPQRSEIPDVKDTKWSINFIDNFTLARLEEQGLTHSPVANKSTLLRRLSFDLTGLPPTPTQVDSFVDATNDRAYEATVDSLLSSPHFGERMAIYWLDLVRYADTVGYHGDQDVSVSPYRDYVINAFNDNMPFDQFTREQLAGDLLPAPTTQQLVASGYNKLGMMSAEGGVQPKEYLAKYAADRVRTASTVWLGSTLGCAECHDHKFDPFTTKDFYRFASFFADIKERGLYSGAHADGKWGPKVDVVDPKLEELLKPLDTQIAALQKTFDTPTDALAKSQSEWEARIKKDASSWQTLEIEKLSATGGVKLVRNKDDSIVASGPNPATVTYTISAKTSLESITAIRIEAIPDKTLPKGGQGRAGNGNFVITEVKAIASQPIEFAKASATFEQTIAGNANPYKKWTAASTIDNDAKGNSFGWAVLPEVSKPQALVLSTKQPVEAARSPLTIVLEQNHGNHTLGRFRLSVSSAVPAPMATVGESVPADMLAIMQLDPAKRSDEQSASLAKYYRSITTALQQERDRLKQLQVERESLRKHHTRTSLITVAVKPRTMRVLARGNWMDDSGEVVQPGVPSFLPQVKRDDRATRLDLANWIVSKENPLTARVMVNRLWKMFFGTGLSKQLDDIGSQGEWPSHPELLDTLAVDLVEHDWDLKRTIKLMVMSQTYRQSSLMRDELRATDPHNRLLARQSRFRFDAEMIRDNALAVSGLLVREVGGRSAKPYQPAGLYRHLNFPKRAYQADKDENQYRRGVYTHWQRQFLHPAMKTFDAPAREECTAQRTRSNTPLAALVLLNDPSYVEAARVFAESALAHEATTDQRLQHMLKTALSREGSTDELAILNDLLRSQRKFYTASEGESEKLLGVGLRPRAKQYDVDELAAWTAVARTIFNMHEFITRN